MMEPIKRRGPFQIMFDLLRNARRPVKKTNLQTSIRVSGSEISMYVSWLLERDLVKEVPYVRKWGRIDLRTPYLYVVTEKGKELIGLYERIYDILGWGLRDD